MPAAPQDPAADPAAAVPTAPIGPKKRERPRGSKNKNRGAQDGSTMDVDSTPAEAAHRSDGENISQESSSAMDIDSAPNTDTVRRSRRRSGRNRSSEASSPMDIDSAPPKTPQRRGRNKGSKASPAAKVADVNGINAQYRESTNMPQRLLGTMQIAHLAEPVTKPGPKSAQASAASATQSSPAATGATTQKLQGAAHPPTPTMSQAPRKAAALKQTRLVFSSVAASSPEAPGEPPACSNTCPNTSPPGSTPSQPGATMPPALLATPCGVLNLPPALPATPLSAANTAPALQPAPRGESSMAPALLATPCGVSNLPPAQAAISPGDSDLPSALPATPLSSTTTPLLQPTPRGESNTAPSLLATPCGVSDSSPAQAAISPALLATLCRAANLPPALLATLCGAANLSPAQLATLYSNASLPPATSAISPSDTKLPPALSAPTPSNCTTPPALPAAIYSAAGLPSPPSSQSSPPPPSHHSTASSLGSSPRGLFTSTAPSPASTESSPPPDEASFPPPVLDWSTSAAPAPTGPKPKTHNKPKFLGVTIMPSENGPKMVHHFDPSTIPSSKAGGPKAKRSKATPAGTCDGAKARARPRPSAAPKAPSASMDLATTRSLPSAWDPTSILTPPSTSQVAAWPSATEWATTAFNPQQSYGDPRGAGAGAGAGAALVGAAGMLDPWALHPLPPRPPVDWTVPQPLQTYADDRNTRMIRFRLEEETDSQIVQAMSPESLVYCLHNEGSPLTSIYAFRKLSLSFLELCVRPVEHEDAIFHSSEAINRALNLSSTCHTMSTDYLVAVKVHGMSRSTYPYPEENLARWAQENNISGISSASWRSNKLILGLYSATDAIKLCQQSLTLSGQPGIPTPHDRRSLPRFCFLCHEPNHFSIQGAMRCTKPRRCGKCSSEAHGTNVCPSLVYRCANCSGNHKAWSPQCEDPEVVKMRLRCKHWGKHTPWWYQDKDIIEQVLHTIPPSRRVPLVSY